MHQPQAHSCSLDSRDTPFQEDDQSGRCQEISKDGVLIVRDCQPFQPSCEHIVVPRPVIDGLLTALHVRFCHPSRAQLKRIFNRYLFTLDIDKASEAVSSTCHQCQAVKSIPKYLHPESSAQSPTVVESSFAADVVRCYRQYIVVLRETVSSYTPSSLIDGERHDQLRQAHRMLNYDYLATIRSQPTSTLLQDMLHWSTTQP